MGNRWSRLLGMGALLATACGSDSTGSPAPDSSMPGTLPSCDSLCPAVLAAKCPQGPVSQADCVSGCETIRAGKCADKYRAVYDCGGAHPVYACDAQGRTTTVGCESLMAALYECAAS